MKKKKKTLIFLKNTQIILPQQRHCDSYGRLIIDQHRLARAINNGSFSFSMAFVHRSYRDRGRLNVFNIGFFDVDADVTKHVSRYSITDHLTT